VTTTDFTLPPSIRSPWQRLYGAAHGLRRRWWEERRRTLPAPVLSVGNVHWGGTGKTPLVAALAQHLRDRGLRLAILSRGYRRRDTRVRVVSDGSGPLLGPLLAGDEPVLLAGMLPGVAVVVGADRFDAGRQALERLQPPPELFLLDDGFSHLALARQLDLVALPAADPFGGGRLPPGGRLREPLAALARADAVILTGAENGAEGLTESLRPLGFEGRAFACRTQPLTARLYSGEPLPADARVVAVAAIARPERFLAAVHAQGFEPAATLTLPDHHAYPPSTLARIAAAMRDHHADYLLTTGKDAVKLHGRLDLPLAELPIRAEPEPAFWAWLDGRLDRLAKGSR
jgi:tetraacyldisaccharide 4'-kinase